MIEDTSRYRKHYRDNPDVFSLFQAPWWLDTVSGPDGWRVCTVTDSDGSPQAWLPITYGRKFGVRILRKPPLTPYVGPVWARKLSVRKQLLVGKQLADAFPARLFGKMTFPPGQSAALAFSWSGYRLYTRYTFFLPGDQENMLASAGRDVRRQLARALDKTTKVVVTDDVRVLQNHVRAALISGQANYSLDEVFNRLVPELLSRGRGELLMATDAKGTPLASQLVAWDQERAYLIAAGMSPVGRENGAFYRLLSEVPRFIPKSIKLIDCCGSMLRGVAQFNAGLGATPVPYTEIRKLPFCN
jgi:hypothetical protein